MGRYGRVYRLWASASSGAYRRMMQVAGSCDVYRTRILPYPYDPLMCVLTPREFPPPPSQLLYCVGLSILTAVSLLVLSEVVRSNRDLPFIQVLPVSSTYGFWLGQFRWMCPG